MKEGFNIKKIVSIVLVITVMLSCVSISALANTGNCKITNALANMLDKVSDEEKIETCIWLVFNLDRELVERKTFEECGLTFGDLRTTEDVDLYSKTYNRILGELESAGNKALIEKAGVESEDVVYCGTISPLVILNLTKEQIYDISDYKEVDFLDYDPSVLSDEPWRGTDETWVTDDELLDTTDPVVTTPSETIPETTTPVVTELPATNPNETTPEFTDPPVTNPNESTPKVTDPITTNPVVTEPSTPSAVVEPTQPSSTSSNSKVTSKKANPIKVSVKTKTLKVKKLKKKAQKVKAITVKDNQGKITYKLVKSGITKKIRKLVSVNSKGIITIEKWKKAKKGTYRIKVTVTAAGNANYNSKTITKTVKVKVK